MKHQGLLSAVLAEFAIHCRIFECRAHEELPLGQESYRHA